MGETVRFGVSMDSNLVELLDNLTHKGGHQNRSETLRGLVRQKLIETESKYDSREVIGTVTLLYYYQTRLPRVSIKPYPSLQITANMQFHVKEKICMKVLVVKGKGDEIYTWTQKLLSNKNIIGKLTITATDEIFNELLK